MNRILSLTFLGFLIQGPCLTGHDSPTHRIEALTARIESEGLSAAWLIDRAFEHNALGDWRKAVADFEAALQLSPHSWSARAGCAKACLNLGEWERAASFALEGIELQDDPSEKAPFFALLAQARMKQEDWSKAHDAWLGALKTPNPQIDWFLGQAETLSQLGKLEEEVDALAEARQRNPSVVLYRAWLHALVDAGHLEQALKEVNLELPKARWKSSWLLLRAQIFQSLGQVTAVSADARAALDEIKTRLNKGRPDPRLLVEEKRALAFLHK